MPVNNIRICKGANCKAWDSDRIARELRKAIDLNHVKVCRISCFDACHGGVSVCVGPKNKLVKIKQVDEILHVFGVRKEELIAS